MSFPGGSTDLGSAYGKVVIGSDLSGVKAAIVALDQFVAHTATVSTQVSASLKNIGQAATDLGQKLSLGLTLPLVAAAGVSLNAASDFNESMSAVQTVFGDAADSVVAFSKDSTASLLLTQQEILQTSATMGNLAKGLGLTSEEAATFSGEIINAAADLSSFFNVSASDALDSLRSGLAGEIEPLRRFGINMSEVEVQLEAVRIGLIETGQEMTESQKVIARQSFILSHMGDATNDLMRTQGSFSNQLKQLQTDLGNLAAEIGQELIPIALKLVGIARDLIAQFRDLPPGLKTAVVAAAALAAAIGPLLIVLGQLAIAVAAVSVAIEAGAIAALVGFAAAAAPVIAVLAGVTAGALIIKQITETGSAAAASAVAVDTMSESLRNLAKASTDLASSNALNKLATTTAAAMAKSTQAAVDNAKALDDLQIAAAAADASVKASAGDPAFQATEQKRLDGINAQIQAIEGLTLTTEEWARISETAAQLGNADLENRAYLLEQLNAAVAKFVAGESRRGELLGAVAAISRTAATEADAHTRSLLEEADAAERAGDVAAEQASKLKDAGDAAVTYTHFLAPAAFETKKFFESLSGSSETASEPFVAASDAAVTYTHFLAPAMQETQRFFDDLDSAAGTADDAFVFASDAAVNYTHFTADAEFATKKWIDGLDAAATKAQEDAAIFFEIARATTAAQSNVAGGGGNEANIGERTPEQVAADTRALADASVAFYARIEDAARSALTTQMDLLDESVRAGDRFSLSGEQIATILDHIATIDKASGSERIRLWGLATDALTEYNQGELDTQGLLRQLDSIGAAALGALVGHTRAATTATQEGIDALKEWNAWQIQALTESSRAGHSASDAAVNYIHLTDEAVAATEEWAASLTAADDAARQAAADFFEAQRAISADTSRDTSGDSLSFPSPEEAKKNADDLTAVSDRYFADQEQQQADLADASEAAAEKRIDAEKQYASAVKSSEKDAADAARDSARDMEKSTRDASVARAQNERELGRTLAEIDAERVDVAAQAEQDLADLSQDRAEKQADYAQQRADVEGQLQSDLADAEQRFAEQQQENAQRTAEVQTQLQQDLSDAQQQYNETQQENADQQAEVRKTLAESLKEASKQWHEANKQAKEDLKDIRTELLETLAESREAFDKFMVDSALSESRLREDLARDLADSALDQRRLQEDLQRTLADLDADASHVKDDLAAKLVDPKLSPEQRAQARIDADVALAEIEKRRNDARFDAQRQLEDLQRREEEAQFQFQRDLADLETRRHEEEIQHEEDDQQARDDAHQKQLDQKKELQDAEQAYHDKRVELEKDARDRISDLEGDLAKAASDFHEKQSDLRGDAAKQIESLNADMAKAASDLADTQSGLRDDALTQIENINGEEAKAMADLAEREQTIYDDRAKAFEDLEAKKTEAFREAEQARTLIARDEQQARDKAARDQDSAERDARRDQRQALRDLNTTEDAIDQDLAEKQGDITGKAFGEAFATGLESTSESARRAGTTLGESAAAAALAALSAQNTTAATGANHAAAALAALSAQNTTAATGASHYAAQVASDQSRMMSTLSSGPQTLSATVVIQDGQLRQYVLGTAIAPMLQSRDRVAAGGVR